MATAEFEHDHAAHGAGNIRVRQYRGLVCEGMIWFSTLEQRKTMTFRQKPQASFSMETD